MPTKPLNGGLVLVIGLPLFAIVASVGTAVVAFTRGDPTLPDAYHWEGLQLDRDFVDARRAFDLNVSGILQRLPTEGLCRITLRLNGTPPEALRLSLIHATRPDLDTQVRLSRVGAVYEGRCGATPSGHWHVELTDDTGAWSVRQEVSAALDGTVIAARPNASMSDKGS